MNQQNSRQVYFAAIDPYLEVNRFLPTEKVVISKDMVEWGTRNQYPDYLLDLYNNVTTLKSIIDGNIDFIAGDEILIDPLNDVLLPGTMNLNGDTINEQVRDEAKDYEIYGGFALQVIRNFLGGIAEVYYIDMRYLRMNRNCDVFYYCEHWDKGGRKDVIVYPAFNPNLDWASLSEEEKNRNASSILFVKNVHTQVYPAPLYAAAVKACEIERSIDDYHLNSIENGFAPSMIVNFNNGDPGDEAKEEIEEDMNEKFCGHQNGGRIMLSWNKDRASATTFETPKVEDFGDRYQALASHSRQQIYSAFRAIPLLFGMTTDVSTGFSTEEFEQSFKLYNRTQIRPVQRLIADAYRKIYGRDVLRIKPFSLSGETETIVD